MKTAEELDESRMELMGNIAVLAGYNKWKDIKQLIAKRDCAIQLDAFQEAARIVQKRREDYDDEHGVTDHETGAREYPKGGDEYVQELQEIEDSILTYAATLKERK